MKKVLIITYYWPPAGGPGVQRVLKFAKYLPEFGWQPIILTVKKGNFPSIDHELTKEIPNDCKVYTTNIFEPFELYKSLIGKKSGENIPTFVLSKTRNEKLIDKMIKWIRANLFIPDAKIGWKSFIVHEGKKIIKLEQPDLIFSSSPPHSLQLGAMKLSKWSGLPWIADFRDPWTSAFWQSDIKRISFAKKKDKFLEDSVVRSCNALITVSESIKNDFLNIRENHCYTITNGFDENDFKCERPKNDKFTIRYTGTLGKDQYINGFIKSLEKVPSEMMENISIEFFGSFHSSIIEQIHSYHLSELFKINNSVSHLKSVELISNADLLLLIIPDTKNNKGIVTGKIFEYLATKNPILGFGPEDGDASKILAQTKCGKMFEHNSDASKFIIEQYERWKLNLPYSPDNDEINSYSRRTLTKKLAEIFGEFS